MASIITIVDLISRPKQIQQRIICLINALIGTEFSLFIAHADRDSSNDKKLKHIISSYQNVNHISVVPGGTEVELSRLRNEAFKRVTSDILIFLDVDIYPDLQLFRSLARQVEAGNPMVIAPCIYLSSLGTKSISNLRDFKYITSSSLNYNPDFVLHWALPSSVMALKKSNYLAIGGFYEGYTGHGYEDFDFMLRMAIHTNLIKVSSDILIDHTYRAPLLSIGFRAILARLCLKNLLDRNIAFHLYHEKNLLSSYYEKRSINAKLFNSRFRNITEYAQYNFSYQSTRTLIDDFFIECANRQINPQDFYSLFDARPRNLLIHKSHFLSLKRKLQRHFS